MELLAGCRVHTEKTTNDPPVTRETSGIEAKVVNLFLPWLKDDIPERTWQVLSRDIEKIIKEVRR
jgi:hypothetical protein